MSEPQKPKIGVVVAILLPILAIWLSSLYDSMAGLIIFISFIIESVLIWVYRDIFGNIALLAPFTRRNIPTVKECPKCGNKLNQSLGQMEQIYACAKCGYQGSVVLNPKN